MLNSAELERKIGSLNAKFSPDLFFEIKGELDNLAKIGFFREIIAFLHDLLRDDVPVAHGFIFTTLIQFGDKGADRKLSRRHIELAGEKFPQGEFWDELVANMLTLEFHQERSRKPGEPCH